MTNIRDPSVIRPRCRLTKKWQRHHRDGFSLVELLVAISIVIALVSIVLPAIFAGREAARRAQCMNNQRQYGVAIQNYVSANGKLPQPRRWLAACSMFMEEPRGDRQTFAAHTMGRALGMGNARCPSTPSFEINFVDYSPTATLVISPTFDGGTRVDAGAWSKSGSLQKISDGLSNTLLLVEQAGLPIVYQARPKDNEHGPWPNRVPTTLEDLVPRGNAGFFVVYAHHETGSAHASYSGMDINRTNHGGIYSFHSGATIAMADGSVAFKSENTDPMLLASLFSRDDGVNEAQRLALHNTKTQCVTVQSRDTGR